MTVTLYDYWRSSACYRVRIVLNLKGVAYEAVHIGLLDGDQRDPAYLEKNPQGLIPMLEIDGHRLTQSLAIIDYLDATHPEPPMVPKDPAARSHVLAAALAIAADIHPINNLRILNYLKEELGQDQAARDAWYKHWIVQGFTALEAMLDPGKVFIGGDAPGIADACLVPQMANARRFDIALDAFPTLVRIDAACNALDAFRRAHPEAVKPANA